MRIFYILTVFCSSSLLRVVLGQEGGCSPSFGTGKITPVSAASSNSRFFLNHNSSAQCNGMVTAYQYCYHVGDDGLIASFAVYRYNDDKYQVVQGSRVQLRRDTANIAGLVCDTLLTRVFQVQEGDVVGACTGQTRGRTPTSLVSSSPAVDHYTILTTECSQFPTEISVDSLTEEEDLVLHIQANIIPADPEPSSLIQPSGTVTISKSSIVLREVSVSTGPLPTTRVKEESSGETTGPHLVSPSIFVLRSTTVSPLPTTRVKEESSGETSSAVVVIVILLLITVLIASAIAITAIVGILYIRSKALGKPPAGPECSNTIPGIDNVLYDARDDQLQTIPQLYEAPRSGPQPEKRYEDTSFQTTVLPDIDYHLCREPQNYTTPNNTMQSRGQSEDPSPYCIPSSKEEELYQQLNSYGIRNIPRQYLGITGPLGSGQFGKVDKGVWTAPHGAVDVAVKTLSTGGDKVKFLQEAAVMAQFRHPNVVMLHGVVCRGSLLMLIVELAHKGDLSKFLTSTRRDPGELVSPELPKLLLDFSLQVNLGMQYLSSKGYVHRDLAARNVLISRDNICKVADFGMSRGLESKDYYVSHGGQVPVKWTALEALEYSKYSTASDVWSFGCLLYEIWSLGHIPFEKLTNQVVLHKLKLHYRLPPPPGCPRTVYEIMIQCWHHDPTARPTFGSLVATLCDCQLESRGGNLPITGSSLTSDLTLGGTLQAGYGLYPDLQRMYCQQ